jgi:hypothetical protein
LELQECPLPSSVSPLQALIAEVQRQLSPIGIWHPHEWGVMCEASGSMCAFKYLFRQQPYGSKAEALAAAVQAHQKMAGGHGGGDGAQMMVLPPTQAGGQWQMATMVPHPGSGASVPYPGSGATGQLHPHGQSTMGAGVPYTHMAIAPQQQHVPGAMYGAPYAHQVCCAVSSDQLLHIWSASLFAPAVPYPHPSTHSVCLVWHGIAARVRCHAIMMKRW